jgi:hypothetical protein
VVNVHITDDAIPINDSHLSENCVDVTVNTKELSTGELIKLRGS